MSRTIKDSVDLLEQSLTDCKTALTEKGVTEVDSIKISDVNEKIAEIQAGSGGQSFPFSIKSVVFDGESVGNGSSISHSYSSTVSVSVELNFTEEFSKSYQLIIIGLRATDTGYIYNNNNNKVTLRLENLDMYTESLDFVIYATDSNRELLQKVYTFTIYNPNYS